MSRDKHWGACAKSLKCLLPKPVYGRRVEHSFRAKASDRESPARRSACPRGMGVWLESNSLRFHCKRVSCGGQTESFPPETSEGADVIH